MRATTVGRRAVGVSRAVFLWIAVCGSLSCGGGGANGSPNVTQFTKPAGTTAEFAGRLDQLRNDLHMPGMSAVIAKDQQIAWSQGFGFADVENHVAATPTTTFHLASLTKTFCSTIVLQLVEQNLLSLETPVSQYGVPLTANGTIRVKHLLSHTSEGTPGSQFIYNGDRFEHLSTVVAAVSGKGFGQLVSERILQPLNLPNTAPNVAHPDFSYSQLDPTTFTNNVAKPYEINGSTAVPGVYPSQFGCAAGLMGSATDVAQYSTAMDRDAFLQTATKNQAWTNFILNGGGSAPYGLGWFVQNINGVKVIWHYGLWTANSSLIIKVPERGLTFVLLANTDRLSKDFNLAAGDVRVSPFAREFINAYVTGNTTLP
jgi:CubicO group peptidase (beta-lactamase class C family)